MAMTKREDKDYYIDYYDQLNDEEKKFIRQFNREYHGDDISRKKREGKKVLITDPEVQKEARRNHNIQKTDMFCKGKREGGLVEYDENRDFMEDASDDWEWRDVYVRDGYDAAVEFIDKLCLNEIKNRKMEGRVVLSRYYSRREELRKIHRKAKK